jgi:fatty-acyl-CoA synthase
VLGGLVVTIREDHFDPDALWGVVAREQVSDLVIVGDAFAKPMLAALRRASDAGQSPDLSKLKRILSSGVMFSREVKEGLLELADVTILDVMGSTEGGMGSSVTSRASPPGETARFMPSPGVKVFDAEGREVTPGSGEVGMVASTGGAQVGYYKDETKTAATFREIDGVRYSFPGDFAKIAADGSLILLGRGSVCINTGGEKVYPEEVEEALKAHPDVFDCLVVGVPDPRFGERVTAVMSLREGGVLDEACLLDFARTRVAGYKLPRRLVVVDWVQRAPNGKADYKWAKSVAATAEATPAAPAL